MPVVVVKFSEPESIVDDPTAYVSRIEGLGLRKDYDDPEAPFFAETVAILRPWQARALKEFRAITPLLPKRVTNTDQRAVEAGTFASGKIDVRFSIDGGTTWFYWDGGAWVVAGASDWSTFDDLNMNLAVIPFPVDWQLTFAVRLQPISGNFTIPLQGLRLSFEIVPTHDYLDIFRTIRRELAVNVKPEFRQAFAMAATGTTLDLGSLLRVGNVVSAYNLTNDPTRQTNILAGYVAPNVQLTASQTAGEIIEVHWLCTMADDPGSAVKPRWVILSNQDPDFYNELSKHIPILIVQVSENRTVGATQLPRVPSVLTINHPLNKYWKEENPDGAEYRIQIFGAAADESLAIKLIDAAYTHLRKLKSTATILRTVNAGMDAEIVAITQAFANLTDTSEKLSVKTLQFLMYTREWRGTTLEGPLVHTLETLLEVKP